MNIRWLYLSIYLMMTSSVTISLCNRRLDGFISSGLLIVATAILLLGSRKLERDFGEY